MQNALENQQSNAVAEGKGSERERERGRLGQEVGHAGSIQVDWQPSCRLECQAGKKEVRRLMKNAVAAAAGTDTGKSA